MSRTTNGSKAASVAGSRGPTRARSSAKSRRRRGAAARHTRLAPASDLHSRFSEHSGDVIKKRQRHQDRQHGHANALADIEGAVGYGTALDEFREIIQQMATIQQRNRQQVEHAETDADES